MRRSRAYWRSRRDDHRPRWFEIPEEPDTAAMATGPREVLTMAKASKANYASGPSPATERKWQVEDAMRTLQRAGEIVSDKKLMEDVKACAEEQADELTAVAKQANALAKAGRISPKQLAKLGAH